jgi:hypothetical protein
VPSSFLRYTLPSLSIQRMSSARSAIAVEKSFRIARLDGRAEDASGLGAFGHFGHRVSRRSEPKQDGEKKNGALPRRTAGGGFLVFL